MKCRLHPDDHVLDGLELGALHVEDGKLYKTPNLDPDLMFEKWFRLKELQKEDCRCPWWVRFYFDFPHWWRGVLLDLGLSPKPYSRRRVKAPPSP